MKAIVKNKSNNTNFIWLVGVLAITFIALSPVLKNGFTNWDDAGYVMENKLINNLSIDNIKKIFDINTNV